MNKLSILFFTAVSVVGLTLLVFSSVNGFTSKNAIVMSKGLTIKATIDGVVKETSPVVGERISTGAALATIENTRIDYSTVYELRAELEANQRRHELVSNQIKDSGELIDRYARKSSSYTDWYTEDLRYTYQQKRLKLSTAKEQFKLSQAAAERGLKLSQSGHIVQKDLERLQRNSVIDKNKVELLQKEIAQIKNRRTILSKEGFIFNSDGNADYWTRMTDELQLDLMGQKNSVLDLELNIEKLGRRLEWETKHIANESTEIHHSPFDGVINAVFSSKGDLVTAETPLLQILDCANPIAIVSVRESALGNFSIGQRATIKPIDTNNTYEGYVQYISNGPLISKDTSLAIPADVSQDGSKIIIAFDQNPAVTINESCDVARRAVVSIDTNGTFQQLAADLKAYVFKIFSDEDIITASDSKARESQGKSEKGLTFNSSKSAVDENRLIKLDLSQESDGPKGNESTLPVKAVLISTNPASQIATVRAETSALNPSPVPVYKPKRIAVENKRLERNIRSTSSGNSKLYQESHWVLAQTASHYTIQIGTTVNQQFLVRFAEKLPKKHVASVFKYRINRSNKDEFALTYGSFSNKRQANAALAGLNKSSRRYGAYVRPFSAIQNGIKKNEPVTGELVTAK